MTTINNKHLVEMSNVVGCTCCCSLMSGNAIEDYCEDIVNGVEEDCTAICPICQVDAIVTNAELSPLTKDVLIKRHHDGFCHKYYKGNVKIECDCNKYLKGATELVTDET